MSLSNLLLRKQIWEALKVDDAGRLADILDHESKARGIELRDLVLQMETLLWRDDGMTRIDKKSLLVVCAGNSAGIPRRGCLACIGFLLNTFPPNDPDVCSRYQIKRAHYSALYHGRPEAANLLQGHMDYHRAECNDQ